MALHLMGGFSLVWTPKGQTQQRGTQPILWGRTTPGYTASPQPSSPVFSWILEKASAHYFCDGHSPQAGATPKCCARGLGFAHGPLPQAPRWLPQPPSR